MPSSVTSNKNTRTSSVPPAITTPGSSNATSDGQYLRGFASWDQVDGALIKYFITNILHWLGQVDLCIAEGAAEPTSFRIVNSESHIASKEDKKDYIFPHRG